MDRKWTGQNSSDSQNKSSNKITIWGEKSDFTEAYNKTWGGQKAVWVRPKKWATQNIENPDHNWSDRIGQTAKPYLQTARTDVRSKRNWSGFMSVQLFLVWPRPLFAHLRPWLLNADRSSNWAIFLYRSIEVMNHGFLKQLNQISLFNIYTFNSRGSSYR